MHFAFLNFICFVDFLFISLILLNIPVASEMALKHYFCLTEWLDGWWLDVGMEIYLFFSQFRCYLFGSVNHLYENGCICVCVCVDNVVVHCSYSYWCQCIGLYYIVCIVYLVYCLGCCLVWWVGFHFLVVWLLNDASPCNFLFGRMFDFIFWKWCCACLHHRRQWSYTFEQNRTTTLTLTGRMSMSC